MSSRLLVLVEVILLVGMAANIYGALTDLRAECWAAAAFGIAAAGYVRALRRPVVMVEVVTDDA